MLSVSKRQDLPSYPVNMRREWLDVSSGQNGNYFGSGGTGLSLRKLLMKQAMKESAPFQREGIMSISKTLSGNIDAKVKRWVKSAKKQGQDLDKMSEQEIKYLIELNKPKAPKVYSNEEAYEILNRFVNQGKKDKGKVIEFPKDKIEIPKNKKFLVLKQLSVLSFNRITAIHILNVLNLY